MRVIIDSYLKTAGLAATLLRAPEVAEHWDEPSALPEFRVGGLAGHIGMAAVFKVEESLTAAIPDQPPVDAAEYFATSYVPGESPDTPAHQRIRQMSEEAAGVGPADLVERVDAALSRLSVALPAAPADRLVFGTRRVLRLDQWVLTRMIELVVHMDDLAVSVGVATPEISLEASDLVIGALARIAARHHGPVAVVRALSRRERATGPINAF